MLCSNLVNGLLKQLKVLHALVLVFGAEVNLGHRDRRSGIVDLVEDLAVKSACATVFDLGVVKLERRVHPVEQRFAADEVVVCTAVSNAEGSGRKCRGDM